MTLALAMIVLGLNVLGNLNKPATSQESLGLAAWRVVIGSGIVVLILGVFNLIAVIECRAITSTTLANMLTELRVP